MIEQITKLQKQLKARNKTIRELKSKLVEANAIRKIMSNLGK
jgi:predicted component of type VI protein secretion system